MSSGSPGSHGTTSPIPPLRQYPYRSRNSKSDTLVAPACADVTTMTLQAHRPSNDHKLKTSHMKITIRPLLAASIALCTMGAAHAQSALEEILDSGVLKVGTTGDWNPMSVRDPKSNKYKGFDIDVMDELASDLGVKVEFVPTDWKTLVNGVTAGKYHLTGSASISAARMKAAGFSTSYLAVEILPFTTTDKADRFDGWDSMNQSDVTIATTLGTKSRL